MLDNNKVSKKRTFYKIEHNNSAVLTTDNFLSVINFFKERNFLLLRAEHYASLQKHGYKIFLKLNKSQEVEV